MHILAYQRLYSTSSHLQAHGQRIYKKKTTDRHFLEFTSAILSIIVVPAGIVCNYVVHLSYRT